MVSRRVSRTCFGVAPPLSRARIFPPPRGPSSRRIARPLTNVSPARHQGATAAVRESRSVPPVCDCSALICASQCKLGAAAERGRERAFTRMLQKGAILAALALYSMSLAAPGGAMRHIPRDASSDDTDEAAPVNEELSIGAAELTAVPAESQALFAKILGRLESMRGEMMEMRADRRRADERIARLEEKDDCEDDVVTVEQQDPKGLNDEMETSIYNYLSSNSTRRHRKQTSTPMCEPASWAARTEDVMDACCPATHGGHRRAQDTCPLPDICPSATCAAAFVPYYDDCALELQAHAAELPLPEFAKLYGSCQELASGASQMLQPVTVQMFRVHVNTESVVQAGAMFPGEGDGSEQPIDPLQPTHVPPSTPGFSSADLGQYHARCASSNIKRCVPTCNLTTHGFEMLATIDDTDTKFSCNLAHGLYSWMGAASEGGYLGEDFEAFLAAVISGAAGDYLVTMMSDQSNTVDLDVQPEQVVHISGDPDLIDAPTWGVGGFVVHQSAQLALTFVQLATTATIQVLVGGDLSLATMSATVEQIAWEQRAGSKLSLMDVSFAGSTSGTEGDPCHGGAEVSPSGSAAGGEIVYEPEGGYPLDAECSWLIRCPGAHVTITAIDLQYGFSGSDAGRPSAPFAALSLYELPPAIPGKPDDEPIELYTFNGGQMSTDGTMIHQRGPSVGVSWANSEDSPGMMLNFNSAHSWANGEDGHAGFRATYSCSTQFVADDFREVPLTQTYTVSQDGHTLSSQSETAVDWQCLQPYIILDDQWRAADPDVAGPAANDPFHCDGDVNYCADDILPVSGPPDGRWFRFIGQAGTGLPTSPPGRLHCGTDCPGWLADWDPIRGDPPHGLSRPGVVPSSRQGVAPITICFDVGDFESTDCFDREGRRNMNIPSNYPCVESVFAQAVNCGSFVLWQLPNVPECPLGYCAAPI